MTNEDTVPPTEDVTTPTPDKEDIPPKTEVISQSNDATAPVDVLSWLQDIELVDHTDSPIGLDRLASSDVLAVSNCTSVCVWYLLTLIPIVLFLCLLVSTL